MYSYSDLSVCFLVSFLSSFGFIGIGSKGAGYGYCYTSGGGGGSGFGIGLGFCSGNGSRMGFIGFISIGRLVMT